MFRIPCAVLILLGFLAMVPIASAEVPSDFDGDGKTDFAVFHRAAGTPGLAYWNYLESSDAYDEVNTQWGVSTDTPVPGDYDWDGLTDPAIWRPGNGLNADWWVLGSDEGEEVYTFGYNTDIPVPRDYNGTGYTEVSVVRPETGTGRLFWFLYDESIEDYCTVVWGLSTDKLVPADYDGDGKAEVAVFRPSDATWYIVTSDCGATMTTESIAWGLSTDKPVPGDYDGDGKYDQAVFRPSDGTWYIRRSSVEEEEDKLLAVEWGLSTDILVPGDYDGDGKFDLAVFRPSNTTWYVLKSSDLQTLSVVFGDSSDTPVPALYIP
ncbi:MAG TPA: VCBS repeat-containing protein [Thermoanaerobaculia bacterium]|nr:VCBS repeat-containing protein [Thermoanaerobaculia bacterium]